MRHFCCVVLYCIVVWCCGVVYGACRVDCFQICEQLWLVVGETIRDERPFGELCGDTNQFYEHEQREPRQLENEMTLRVAMRTFIHHVDGQDRTDTRNI